MSARAWLLQGNRTRRRPVAETFIAGCAHLERMTSRNLIVHDRWHTYLLPVGVLADQPATWRLDQAGFPFAARL